MNENSRIEIFKNEINEIKDKDLKKLCKALLLNADEYFFTAPALVYGKKHPEYTNIPGGLVLHAKATFSVLLSIIETNMFNITEKERDLLLVAAMFHDIKIMNNDEKKVIAKNHPLLSSEFIKEINKNNNIISDKDLNYLCNVIETHMGQYGNKPLNLNNIGSKILHIADFIVSKKDVEIHFDTKEVKKSIPSIEDYIVDFGKYNGKHINEIPKDYLEWCLKNVKNSVLISVIKKFLKERDTFTQ